MKRQDFERFKLDTMPPDKRQAMLALCKSHPKLMKGYFSISKDNPYRGIVEQSMQDILDFESRKK